MLLHIKQVLTSEELREARGILADAPWGDGRITAGSQSAHAKNNEQLREDCEETRALQQLLLRGLERHQLFFSAALPKQISPPLFNRYGGASNSFGNHVDSAVRFLRDGSGRVRTDISMVLYPGTSVHRVLPVTRGYRTASYFWIQSMVRSDEQRRLLFEMDNHLRHLRSQYGETDSGVIGLTSTYHNLLRMWLDV
ncbi:MAG: PKHD-type hydroxylase [Burkholderiales bacterium]|nr:PKHD-type hydroxylase [Burkholderiales bacterium]